MSASKTHNTVSIKTVANRFAGNSSVNVKHLYKLLRSACENKRIRDATYNIETKQWYVPANVTIMSPPAFSNVGKKNGVH